MPWNEDCEMKLFLSPKVQARLNKLKAANAESKAEPNPPEATNERHNKQARPSLGHI